ncbi:hypothetical protein [Microcoleus sp. Pol12B4]|uniref:hypothetical protein n=1 Tax=Microcoleus sp. Pol12B4 TaxID=3055395 RepID=UPI002FCFB212
MNTCDHCAILGNTYPKLKQLNYQSLHPNLSTSKSPKDLEAKVDKNFQALANTDSQVGNILRSSENFYKIHQNWQNFKRRSQWSLGTYAFVYQCLATDIDRLSARVGDTSNLISDPDLDTYYLTTTTWRQLPEMEKFFS